MGSLVRRLVVPTRPDPEDAFDLVGVGEALAGKPPGDRQERLRLRGDPRPSLRREVAALEVGEQRPRLLDEPRRLERLRCLRLGRAVIAPDERRLVLADPEGEREVALGEAQGVRSDGRSRAVSSRR
jgi:hypothetical protein